MLLATCYLLLTTYYRCHLQQLLGVEEASAQVLQLHLIRVRVRVGVRVGVRSGVRVGFKVGVRVGFKVGVRVGVARGSLSLTGSAQVLQLHLIRVRVRVGVRVGVRSGVRVGFKVGVRVGFKVGVRVGVARGSLSLTGSAQVLQLHRELDKIGGAEQLALVDLEDGRAHADEAHRPVHNEHIPHAQ